MGMQFNRTLPVKEASISMVVIRKDGRKENRGVVSYYHNNPFRRIAWNIHRWIKERKCFQ